MGCPYICNLQTLLNSVFRTILQGSERAAKLLDRSNAEA